MQRKKIMNQGGKHKINIARNEEEENENRNLLIKK